MPKIVLNFTKTLQGSNGSFKLEIDKCIESGTLLALFGKSGAGKTSILRILSGLDSVDSGFISVDNEVWLDSKKNINLPTQKRSIGFVFQHYALFPHLNVYQNICFGLDSKKDKAFAESIINLMDLNNLVKMSISKLSGGQSQRVALARAIARKPKILLLDEPFCALDRAMSHSLQEELKKLHKQFSLTTILVSHNLSEILYLAQRVFILKNGKISSDGNSEDVFLQKRLDGKIKILAEIVDIAKYQTHSIFTLLCGNEIFKIKYEINHNFAVGEQVIMAVGAFSPLLYKLDSHNLA